MHQGLHQGTLHKRREVWHVAVYLRVYVITSLFRPVKDLAKAS